MAKQWQQKVYNVIRDDDENTLAGKLFDGFIIFIIALTVLFLVLDSFAMPVWYHRLSAIFEVFSIAVFTVEYLLRVWTAPLMFPNQRPAKARRKYIFSFMALIDLISIMPFYLPFIIPVDLRVLRVLRIFKLSRIFKINRYTDALNTIWTVLKRKSSQLLSSLFALVLLIIIASILIYNVENEAQPNTFANALSGIWWAVSTITSVGYGDIYPVTMLGKILTTGIALLGVGLVAVPTGILSAGFVEVFQSEQQQKNLQTTVSIAGEITRCKQLLDEGTINKETFEAIVEKLVRP